MYLLVGLVLSAMIGVSLGLIGGGGSIITVPVLVYVIGVEPQQAIGMSLVVVGMTSLFGMALHAQRGTVVGRTGLFFGASGIAGAYWGSRLTYLVSSVHLMLIFAALMIIIAVLMLVRKQPEENNQEPFRPLKAALAGVGVGVLTGFLGVGGGFLIVPALLLFGGLRMKDAIGTSLLVIFFNCAAALFGHMHHGSFNWNLTFVVSACAALGTLVGAALSHHASPTRLRAGFAALTLAVAVFLIAKNTFLRPPASLSPQMPIAHHSGS